jgi:hypothetical protein
MISEYPCPKLVLISKSFEKFWWDHNVALALKICPFSFPEFFKPLALMISCYQCFLASSAMESAIRDVNDHRAKQHACEELWRFVKIAAYNDH